MNVVPYYVLDVELSLYIKLYSLKKSPAIDFHAILNMNLLKKKN